MRLAVVGLGRMGANIARRLLRAGHDVIGFDENADAVAAVAAEGAARVVSLAELVSTLEPPRIFWVMLPAGAATETAVAMLLDLAEPNDVIIDGGNSFWKDDLRRAEAAAAKGLHYIDVGTSGGIWGLERGYCMMIGGDSTTVEWLDPIFATLAPGPGAIARTGGRDGAKGHDPRAERGYIHAGPAGAGHFVKMVHNGIEYGLMQAFAEEFDLLKGRGSEQLPENERFDLNLADIAEVWRRGSVVSSWLLDLAAEALARDGTLNGFGGSVADSGEGRWAVEAAMEEAVPAGVLAAALFARYRSRVDHMFGEKLLSAMRLGFGGHVEAPKEP